MITLLLAIGCGSGGDDSNPKDTVDTGGGETGETADTTDTTDTTVDTQETGETGETGDTGETGETGDTSDTAAPPDDGGPPTKAACTADWSEVVTDGTNTGRLIYDADEQLTVSSSLQATGETEDVVTTYDENGCITEQTTDSTDAAGAPTHIEINSECDTSGYQTRSYVMMQLPGSGDPVVVNYTLRYTNIIDGSGRLTVRETYKIQDDVETFVIASHYVYDADDNVTQMWTDVDDDGVEDTITNYTYDAESRLFEERLDSNANASADSIMRSEYFVGSNREWHKSTVDPDDGTSILKVRQFVWDCP